MALIDFHCHLDLYPDPFAVADEAVRRGVYILSVTTTPSAFAGTKKLAPADGRIQTAVGLHPELAVARERELVIFERVLSSTKYVGEVGLDGSRDHRETLEHQRAILESILDMCVLVGGRTISLHSRGATKAVLSTIQQRHNAGRFVLHWFSGSEREVRMAAEMGCWFSIGATMLRSERGRKAILAMPMDRILPETDGPFGMDGDRALFPWEASDISEELGPLLRSNPQELTDTFKNNFKHLVGMSV